MKPTESEQKHEIISETLSVLQLAKLKGFESNMNIKSFMLEHWMPIQDIFANTVCAALQWWLRSKHNIQISITSLLKESKHQFIYKWYGCYYLPDGTMLYNSMSDQYFESYELANIDAIKYALNALPPAAQG